jgi:hypothetical protein
MIGAILPVVGTLIDKLFPDKQAADEAKIKMMELAQKGELAQLDAQMQLSMGQIETNKIEAASTDPFRAGWRPMAGWACSLGLFYEFLLRPILPWLVGLSGAEVAPMPSVDIDQLMILLGGLLGLGSLRSFERVKGKA